MRSKYYSLDESNECPVPCSLTEWAYMFNDMEKRRVEFTTVGDSKVSTVFLGLDHNYSSEGPPVLWETLVTEGPNDGEMDRCSGTRQDAIKMHNKMVAFVTKGI